MEESFADHPEDDQNQPEESGDPGAEEASDQKSGDVSLDQLSAAFAQMMQQPGGETAPPAKSTEESAAAPDEDEPESEPPPPDVSPISILEAMLFVGDAKNQPLTAERAAAAMRGVEPDEVHQLVAELNEQYERNGCPYIIESQGTGYRLVLGSKFGRLRDKFYGRVRQARLSQAAIDVLALVAYQQPVTREDVDRQRGAGSGSILTQLVRRQLLRIERAGEKPKVTRYWTTPRFLKLFGLESLKDLPRSHELDHQ